jgi:hypothetical protein
MAELQYLTETRGHKMNHMDQSSPRREVKPQFDLEKYFNIRMAIIEIRLDETKEEAWSRHLAEHPEDSYANIKVFSRSL